MNLDSRLRGNDTAAHVTRLKTKLRGIQGYWSRKAKAKGLLTEKDLERYLRK